MKILSAKEQLWPEYSCSLNVLHEGNQHFSTDYFFVFYYLNIYYYSLLYSQNFSRRDRMSSLKRIYFVYKSDKPVKCILLPFNKYSFVKHCEGRQRELKLRSLERTRLQSDLNVAFQNLRGAYKKDRERFL